MYEIWDEIVEDQQQEVLQKEIEVCLAHLRFLSNFYITIIENKQNEMNAAHNRFLCNRDDMVAYNEWTGTKKKIFLLYECWLRELNDVRVLEDGRVLTMHQMMAADCYWFLAKMHRPAFRPFHSNFDEACRCLDRVLSVLAATLPAHNPFFVHIVQKYEQLVEDYRAALGDQRPSLFGGSKRIPMNMFPSDVDRLRESMDSLRFYQNRAADSPQLSSKWYRSLDDVSLNPPLSHNGTHRARQIYL